MADVAAGGAAHGSGMRHRRRAECRRAATRAGDYAGAMKKAAYDMGSVDQVDRELLASSAAGRISKVRTSISLPSRRGN